MKAQDIIRLHHLKKIIEKYKNRPLYEKIFVYAGLSILGAFLTVTLFFVIFVIIIAIQLPDADDLEKYKASQSSLIYSSDGTVLYKIHGEENRTVISFDEISKNVINASIAIEDDAFYDHHGVDFKAILAAIVSELTFQKNRGGSTITQQYIKNTFLNSERKYSRKMAEILMALKLEQSLSKEEILELYFNRIPYGQNAYGIEEASKTYFGKNAKELSLAESVVLAALPQAPSYFSPYGEHKFAKLDHLFNETEIAIRGIDKHADLREDEFWEGLIGATVSLDSENKHQIYLAGRTDNVLKRMLDLGFITEDEREQTLAELQTMEFKEFKEDILAPHFVLWIKDQLEAKYGKDFVEKGGLKIYTTLDLNLQTIAEEATESRYDFNLRNYGASNAALLSLNPQTGAIISMVGSADFFNDEIDGKVNMTISYTPVGSSYKPFVYANGFWKHGLNPATVIYDTPTDFGDGNYPKNFDGTFMGPIPIRKALAQSRNLPALKAYFLSGEQKEIIPFTQKLGMDYLEPNVEHGSSLALGPTAINFMSFIEAYSTFGNGGLKIEPFGIIKIVNSDAELIYEWKEPIKQQVLDPQVAYLISDILSDESIKLGPSLSLNGRPVATKTGTSTKRDPNNNEIRLPKDLIAIGFTPSLITGVWTGNTDGSATKGLADGYNTSAPIWKKYMEGALAGKPIEQFTMPSGITRVTVSKATGLLPSSNTPEDMLITEKFATFNIPKEVESTNVFRRVRIDKLSNALATEFCPEELIEEKTIRVYHETFPQFYRWEIGVQNWAAGQNLAFSEEPCTLHNGENNKLKPSIYISSPEGYSTIKAGAKLKIEVNVESNFGIEKIEFFLNDVLRATATEDPYTTTIFISPSFEDGEEIILEAKITDKLGYTESSIVNLKISNNSSDKEEDKQDSTNTETEEISDDEISTVEDITTPIEDTIPNDDDLQLE